MWIQECGLVTSHFTTVPFNLSGRLWSNSAANAWCAHAGAAVSSTPKSTSSFVFISRSFRIESMALLCCLGCGGPLCRFRLGHASAAEGICQWIIRLVACVLVELPVNLGDGQLAGPRFRPHSGIFHRELV